MYDDVSSLFLYWTGLWHKSLQHTFVWHVCECVCEVRAWRELHARQDMSGARDLNWTTIFHWLLRFAWLRLVEIQEGGRRWCDAGGTFATLLWRAWGLQFILSRLWRQTRLREGHIHVGDAADPLRTPSLKCWRNGTHHSGKTSEPRAWLELCL